MTNIKKELRKSAKELLPNDELKNNIKAQLGIDAGKSVVVQNDGTVAVSKDRRSRKLWLSVAAAACVCVLACVGIIFGIGNTQLPISDTFISLDINPSIEMVADKNDKIVSIKPINKDGVILLYGIESMVGKSAKDACKFIIDESIRLGFVKADKNVKLVAVNDNLDKEENISHMLQGELESLYAEQGFSVSIPDYKISTMKANLAKTTPNKMALAQEASISSGKTLGQLEKVEAEELNKLSKKYDETDIKQTKKKLETAFDSATLNTLREQATAVKNIKRDIEKHIDNVDEYFDNAQSYIDAFNIKYPQYAFTKKEFTKIEFEKFYENIIDNQVELELEALEDRYEEEYDNIKKQVKNQLDEEDDD